MIVETRNFSHLSDHIDSIPFRLRKEENVEFHLQKFELKTADTNRGICCFLIFRHRRGIDGHNLMKENKMKSVFKVDRYSRRNVLFSLTRRETRRIKESIVLIGRAIFDPLLLVLRRTNQTKFNASVSSSRFISNFEVQSISTHLVQTKFKSKKNHKKPRTHNEKNECSKVF